MKTVEYKKTYLHIYREIPNNVLWWSLCSSSEMLSSEDDFSCFTELLQLITNFSSFVSSFQNGSLRNHHSLYTLRRCPFFSVEGILWWMDCRKSEVEYEYSLATIRGWQKGKLIKIPITKWGLSQTTFCFCPDNIYQTLPIDLNLWPYKLIAST